MRKQGFTPLEILAGSRLNNVPSNHRGNPRFLTGFTLIELLVVVAIIGLLISVISASLNIARTKSRDARRVADLKQIKSGMDIYFSNGSGYPDTTTWVPGTSLACSGTNIMRIPDDPRAPTYRYVYTASGSSLGGCEGTVRGAYELEFYIENKALYYIMNEDGNLREKVSGAPVSFDALL